jgi:hypothetical protein
MERPAAVPAAAPVGEAGSLWTAGNSDDPG